VHQLRLDERLQLRRRRAEVFGKRTAGQKGGEDMSNDAPGMRGDRSRNLTGELRQKRGDTHVGTIEEQYGRDFNVRSDMRLDTLLRREGADSLSDLLKKG
jgi:hypothetical protein